MAIFDLIPGIEVSVCVDKQPLPEFDDDEVSPVHKAGSIEEYQATRTVSKYVQSADDKEFEIRLVAQQPYKMDCPELSVKFFVDGVHIDESVVGSYLKLHQIKEYYCPGTITRTGGSSILKPLKFSRIKLSSNDIESAQIQKEAKLISHVGTITVQIFRCEQQKVLAPGDDKQLSFDDASEVHEKSLKGDAKFHRASFGAPRPISNRQIVSLRYIDGKDYPIAIFRFKYRSEEALKQLYVIKRTPEPEEAVSSPTAAGDDDFSDQELTEEQERVVKEFAKNLKKRSSSARIKREHDDSGPSQGWKKRRSSKSSTIDLTADTDDDDDDIVAPN